MFNITNDTLEKWLKEDIPYMDLTTCIMDIGSQNGEMHFFSRDEAVLCGTEEVARLTALKEGKVLEYLSSGSKIFPGQIFMKIAGSAGVLHLLWKTSQNILEYASGVASRTNRLVEKARKVNENISILSTRKVFPGTKELCIKAVLSGGGLPHRLGLSESILIFKQHRVFDSSWDKPASKIKKLKTISCEKKIIIEIEQPEEALDLCHAGTDGLQFDKLPPEILADLIRKIKKDFPQILCIAAGGINENNIDEYAATGVDAIVTTSMYFGRPVNIGVTMKTA
ncbi:MAG: ModD protein [Dethiobacteria bacterium]|jgi:molybdenum transport protein